MRPVLKLLAVSALIVALSACTSAPPPPPATTEAVVSARPIEVAITYELVTDTSGGVIINAESNLPDGAEMSGSFFVEGGYFGQDEGVLQGGKISFGPFSDKKTPLQGIYQMSITLPIARNQPEGVQAKIGTAGELMTGSLVSTDDISGDKYAGIDVQVTLG